MKASFKSIVIACLVLISCSQRPDHSYSNIPGGLFMAEDQIRLIKPEKEYKYWACIHINPFLKIPKTEIITGKGNIEEITKLKFTPPNSGFLTEMWKGHYYIIYLENDLVHIVSNEQQLIKFIGKINSLEKALLISRIKGLNIDYDRPIGRAYKKVENGYELYLVKFHKCTVRTEPFKVKIDTMGNYKARSLGFYYNVDENICAD